MSDIKRQRQGALADLRNLVIQASQERSRSAVPRGIALAIFRKDQNRGAFDTRLEQIRTAFPPKSKQALANRAKAKRELVKQARLESSVFDSAVASASKARASAREGINAALGIQSVKKERASVQQLSDRFNNAF